MATWITLALLALAAAAVLWQRRRLRRARSECRRRLEEFLASRRPGVTLVTPEPGVVALESGGRDLASFDLARLTRAAASAAGRRELLFAALADTAGQRPRPLGGAYELKRHGPRTLPRLAGEALGLLAAPARPVLFVPPELPLALAYRVRGEPGLTYLTEDHLAGAGIDARDLHGVALAVLRQGFDPQALRRRIAAEGLARLETEDGCAGSLLLLLPEAVEPGERWFAAAPTPAILLAGRDRQALAAAAAEAAELPEALPPVVFRATTAGLAPDR